MLEEFLALFRVFQPSVDVVNVYVRRVIVGVAIGVDGISMVMVVVLERCLLSWKMRRLVVLLLSLV